VSDSEKKKWSKPRLMIYVKTGMAERVLANCKHSYQSFNGPGGQYNICTVYTSCVGRCSTSVGS